MGRYAVHRSDANAEMIVDALLESGASVEVIHRPVDYLVSIEGVCGLAEIKTRLGKLRPSQEAFLKRFHGPVAILRTADEARTFVTRLKGMAPVGE